MTKICRGDSLSMQRIKSWSIQATTREAKLDDRRLEKCCLDFCLNRKVGSEFNVNSMRLKCLLTSNDAPLKEQTEVVFLLTMRYSFICLLSIQLFLNNATIKLIRQKAITWKYDCWENNKKYRQKANFCPVQHFLSCVTLLIQYSETDFRQMVCCIIYSIIL